MPRLPVKQRPKVHVCPVCDTRPRASAGWVCTVCAIREPMTVIEAALKKLPRGGRLVPQDTLWDTGQRMYVKNRG